MSTDKTNDPVGARLLFQQILAVAGDPDLPIPHEITVYRDWDPPTVFLRFNEESQATQEWADALGVTHRYTTVQPYPLTGNYERWTTRFWGDWLGWQICFINSEPISEEHIRGWIDSGGAARHAEDADGGEPR